MRFINQIILHDSSCFAQIAASVDEIRELLNVSENNLLPHHFYINPNGDVLIGKPIYATASTVRYQNANSVDIVLVGTEKFTQNQFRALEILTISLQAVFPIGDNICCHNHLDTTIGCPHFSFNPQTRKAG